MHETNVTPIRSVKEVQSQNKDDDMTTAKKVEPSQNNATITNNYSYNTLPPAGNSGGLFLTSIGFSLLLFITYKVCRKTLGRRLYG